MATESAQTRKRINIELPAIIFDRLDKLARKSDSSRSELIRSLISEILSQKERGDVMILILIRLADTKSARLGR